jgi:hypothetical protein
MFDLHILHLPPINLVNINLYQPYHNDLEIMRLVQHFEEFKDEPEPARPE